MRFFVVLLTGLLLASGGAGLSAQSITEDSVAWYHQRLSQAASPLERARLETQLGWFLSSTRHMDRAIQLIGKAIPVLGQHGDHKTLWQAYMTLGQAFQFQHNLPRAVQYAKKSLEEARLAGDKATIVNAYQNYGMILGEARQYGLARQVFGEALAMAAEAKDTLNTLLIYLNAASVLIEQGDYPATLRYAERGLALAKNRHLTEPMFRGEAIVGAALMRQRRFAEADSRFREAEAYLPVIGSVFYDREMAFIRTEWARKQGKYRQAYAYLQKYFRLDTMLANTKNKQKVAELETTLRTREKEFDNQKLRHQLASQRGIFAAGVLIVGLLAALFYSQRCTLANRNELLKTQHELATVELNSVRDQLRSFAGSVAEKNALLDQLKRDIEELKDQHEVKHLTEQLHQARMLTDAQWNEFRLKFEQINPQFINRLYQQIPNLTATEVQTACMIRLNFSTQQMAGMLGISAESVAKNKYRLRKKLQADSLNNYIAGV